MSKGYTEFLGTPGFVLTWVSELMKFYPWLMRASDVLHRLVQ